MTTITRNDGTQITVKGANQAQENFTAMAILASFAAPFEFNNNATYTSDSNGAAFNRPATATAAPKKIGRPLGSKNKKN